MQVAQARIQEIEAWLQSTIAPDMYAGREVVNSYNFKRADLYAELLLLKGERLPRKSEFGCVYQWEVGFGWVRVG